VSEPIKVGDLVVVVKACCDMMVKHKNFGRVFTVTGFNTGRLKCHHCAFRVPNATWAEFGLYEAYLPWLKRIPPLSELDDVKNTEELTA
jgi:hypothetical protein